MQCAKATRLGCAAVAEVLVAGPVFATLGELPPPPQPAASSEDATTIGAKAKTNLRLAMMRGSFQWSCRKATSIASPPVAPGRAATSAWCASAIARTIVRPRPIPAPSQKAFVFGANRVRPFGARLDLDSAAGDVVPNSVRDEVRDEALDEVRIPACPCSVERDDAFERPEVVRANRVCCNGREVDRLRTLQAGPAPRQSETRFEQSFLLPARLQRVRADLSPGERVHRRVGERKLQQRALRRERRAQLVCDERGEALHVTDGRETFARPRRARAVSFGPPARVAFHVFSPCGVRAKVLSAREAQPCGPRENGTVQTIELDHLLVEARQRLSGRTGTVALISLLTV